jgi:hypothetical protein
MRSHLQLLHAFDAHLQDLLPGVHRARVRVLALLTLGLLWAEAVALPRIAATLPLTAKRASTEKRLARFLANAEVEVAVLWAALLPSLLSNRAGAVLELVFDPTPHNGTFTILSLGLIDHSRVLPVAWVVQPQQTAWSEAQIDLLTQLCATVDRARPPGCRITLLTDRGITSPAVIALCRRLGWHFVLRLSVSARQTNRVRVGAVPEQALWALVRGPGHRFAGPVQLYKEAGWVAVELTITWPRRYAEPWVLLSDQPAGPAIVRTYRRRFRAEATYQDCKTRGWHLDASKLRDRARFDRLLLALHLALWWALQLGHRVIRAGQRARYDRADRRDLGVLRLGREHLRHELLHGRCPPLPFPRRGAAARTAAGT